MEISVVSSVLKDKDGYLPLHVFVPIMESLSKGNGDQDVLMKLDWNSLKKSDGNISVPDETEKKDDKKPEITNKGVKIKTPAGERVLAEGYYAVSGEMFKAVDRNQHSMANDAINHKVIIKVKDGKADLLMDFNGLDINGRSCCRNCIFCKEEERRQRSIKGYIYENESGQGFVAHLRMCLCNCGYDRNSSSFLTYCSIVYGNGLLFCEKLEEVTR